MKKYIFIILMLLASCAPPKHPVSSHPPLEDTTTVAFPQVDSAMAYPEQSEVEKSMSSGSKAVDRDVYPKPAPGHFKPVIHHQEETTPVQPKNLLVGGMVFQINDTMETGKPYTAKLRIAVGKQPTPVPQLQIQVEKTVKVGPRMSAELSDGFPPEEKKFDIQMIGNAKKVVGVDLDYTEWSWTVIPLHKGDYELHLVLSIVHEDGTPEEIVDDSKVLVKSNASFAIKTFYAENIKWFEIALTSIVIPLIVFFWKRRKKKDEAES